MERNSEVLTAVVDVNGVPYSASYFTERGTLYANIGGRIIVEALGSLCAEDKVESLLRGFAERDRRRLALLDAWDTTNTVPR